MPAVRGAELVFGEEVGELVCGDEAIGGCDEEQETTCYCGRTGGGNDEVCMKETAGFVGTSNKEGESLSREVVVVNLSTGCQLFPWIEGMRI